MDNVVWRVFVISLFFHANILRSQVCSSDADDGMFTSTTDLEKLLSTEAELVKTLKNYLKIEEDRISKLKRYVTGYEDIQARAAEDVEAYVGHPVNSYLLIKKLTSDFKEVKDLMTSQQGEVMLSNISQPLRWPSDEDLSGAAAALTRLQDTYKLKAEDLADGRLNGVGSGPVLSAHDCFELGRQSYNGGNHVHTKQWMAEALRRLEAEKGSESASRVDILEYVAFSWYTQGNIAKALQYTDELLAIEPDHERAARNKLYYVASLGSSDDAEMKKGDDGQNVVSDTETNIGVSDEHSTYQKLCRGENVPNKSKSGHTLKCFYDHGTTKYLLLAPYKAEELHADPRIVMYYDVLSEAETATVKSLARPRFRRATVQNYLTGDLQIANYRISKTAWIRREEHDHVERIYERVAHVTGLNMETSEELQVSNYGIGGHYEPHYDFARREEKNAFASLGTGNRIATWLFYLSDVNQGGATVFPTLGLTLWPKSGSAVFWYNLYRNGEGDVRTRHAACPVLAGTKWVSNFWIHERGQEFARPCSVSSAQ